MSEVMSRAGGDGLDSRREVFNADTTCLNREGDASQWQPNLFRNTTAIYPFLNNPGWNLETAMADEAIQYVKQLKEIAPGKE